VLKNTKQKNTQTNITNKNTNNIMFHTPSPTALLIIGVLLVIFFGKDKLEGTARSFGKSLKGFKEEMSSVSETTKLATDEINSVTTKSE
jgi:TatA/E family protein of Tat protein translocase